MIKSALAALGISALALAAPASARDEMMPWDTPVLVNGIDMVCTGIGEAQDDPRWKTYPLRVEFAGGDAQYLSRAEVVIARENGDVLATVKCPGAWLLLMVPPGKYQLTATLLRVQAAPQTIVASAPESGQVRAIIRFPDVTGMD